MAELLGRADGYCRGKGGSHAHRRLLDRHPRRQRHRRRRHRHRAGAALSAAAARERPVASASSATARSTRARSTSAANLAAIWKLPVVSSARTTSSRCPRASAQMTAVREPRRTRAARTASGRHASTAWTCSPSTTAVAEAVERARAGEGPSLVVADLPLHGPPRRRPDELPHRGRGGRPGRARPDRALPRAPRDEHGTLRRRRSGGRPRPSEAEIAAALEFAKASPFPDVSSRLGGHLCLSATNGQERR